MELESKLLNIFRDSQPNSMPWSSSIISQQDCNELVETPQRFKEEGDGGSMETGAQARESGQSKLYQRSNLDK